MEEYRKQQIELLDILAKGKTTAPAQSTNAIPSFPAFDPSSELLADYMNRYRTFTAAHTVSDDKTAGVFLTNQSPTLYKQLSNLASQLPTPKSINELTMDEIETFLKAQYDPTHFVVRERYKFWSDMTRKPGENIHELAARIRQDASTCTFNEINDPLDEAMRTRFMCSVNNEAVLKALFKVNITDLTFQKAIQVALETEEASKVAKETIYGAAPKVNKVDKERMKTSARTHNTQGRQLTERKCYRCDSKGHDPENCKFRTTVCNFCHKAGHIEKACLTKKRKTSPNKAKNITSVQVVKHVPELQQKMILNGRQVTLELDTGACDNFISQTVWNKLGRPSLTPTEVSYESATQHEIDVIGHCEIRSKLPEDNGQGKDLHFVVSRVPDLNLLGRRAIKDLGISIDAVLQLKSPQVNAVKKEKLDTQLQQACKDLCTEFPDVFSEDMGCLKDFELEVSFKEGSKPVFCRPRPVPFAMTEDLNQTYDAGIAKGIWKPVQFSAYGTPVVPVRKHGGKIRVCGDYSRTVNTQLETHRQPIPLPEDLIRRLGGGHGYTKLDLADAYNQITLGPESQRKLALSTHRGVLLQMRLPFGISSAPGYFQEIMEQLTSDLPGVAVYLDDILVSGASAPEHLANLRRLLQRLSDKGLRCKLEKCRFAQASVEYLGHKLTTDGVEKGMKADAVKQMPPPSNITELRSFLGSLQFYRKFLPNLSAITTPLNKLLRKGEQWCWGDEQEASFNKLRDMLSADTVLAHFDPDAEIGLSCDASETGLGAVLFHRYPDGSERPIENVSKTLSDTQKRYGQIQKEALSIIFGLKKFHQFLYGRRFALVTDHKPLLALFGPKKGVPTLAANRLSRWALLLSQYEYTVEYRPTDKHGNADALSRLPVGPDKAFDAAEDQEDVDTVCTVKTIGHQLEANSKVMAKETSKDPVLSLVMRYTTEGWPMRNLKGEENAGELHQLKQIADSLSVVENCLLYGNRIVIPVSLRPQILNILHLGHFGMQRMKQLARTAVYWPRIDSDIEDACRKCSDCGENQRHPPKYPVHPWMMPEKPWSRLHIDHAINFMGSSWLVIVDAYSKYPSIHRTNTTSTKATTDILEEVCANFGYPHTIVSDNATSFTSGEFKDWCAKRGIIHLTGAPYHPATNGAAERLVATFKQSMKKSKLPPKAALQEFLMHYRRTPLATGFSPSQLLNGRQMRCKIDTLLPSPAHIAQEKQSNESYPKKKTVARTQASYKVGDPCYALYCGPNRNKQPRWVSAVVTKVYGQRSVNVKVVPRGPTWRRHLEQLRPRYTSETDEEPADDYSNSQAIDDTVVDISQPTDDTPPNDLPPVRRRNPRWPTGDFNPDDPRRSERLKTKRQL